LGLHGVLEAISEFFVKCLVKGGKAYEGGFKYAVELGYNFVIGDMFVDISECHYKR